MTFKQWVRDVFGPESRAARASRRGKSRRPANRGYIPLVESLESRRMLAILTVNSLSDNIDHSAGNSILTLREAIAVVNADSTTGLQAGENAQITGMLGTNDTIQFDPTLATMNVGFGNGVVGLNDTAAFDQTAGPSALAIIKPVIISGLTGSNGITITRNGTAGTARLFFVSATGNLTLQNLTLSGGDAQGFTGGIGLRRRRRECRLGRRDLQPGHAGDPRQHANRQHRPGRRRWISHSAYTAAAAAGPVCMPRARTRGPPVIMAVTAADPMAVPEAAPLCGGAFRRRRRRRRRRLFYLRRHGRVRRRRRRRQQRRCAPAAAAVSAVVVGAMALRASPVRAVMAAAMAAATAAPQVAGGGGGAGMGGAIFNEAGTVVITNSTITGNTANGGAGGLGISVPFSNGGAGQGLGGGLFNLDGSVTLLQDTFAYNTVSTNGGSVVNLALNDPFVPTNNASLTLYNSILCQQQRRHERAGQLHRFPFAHRPDQRRRHRHHQGPGRFQHQYRRHQRQPEHHRLYHPQYQSHLRDRQLWPTTVGRPNTIAIDH